MVDALGRALGLVGRHRPHEHVRRVPAKQPGRGGGLLGHGDDRVVRFPHSHKGEPYLAVRLRLEGEGVMRRADRMRFCPRGRLGARERDDLQGLRERDVRENLPLVPGARARARVLGAPVAGLRVRRVRARLTAGNNHPVGGAGHRRDLVRRSVPDSHHVNVSWHPRKVAARPARCAAPRGVPAYPAPCSPRWAHEFSFSTAMPESSLRFRLVIARVADSTPGDVSGIVTRLHTDTELFWLLRIARPVAAAPKVCRRSVATCLALLMLDDHLRVLRVLPMASVPHTPGTGVLRRDGVIQTYLGGVLPPRALADTKRIAELLINGHSSYLDTVCQALSGDETPEGFEAVPADHALYDPEAKRYFAPPLTVWYRADVLVHPVVPSTGTT